MASDEQMLAKVSWSNRRSRIYLTRCGGFGEVALRALEAGERRRAIAQAARPTTKPSGGGDAAKRTRADVIPTPSTQVTPETKKGHIELPDTVEPRQLSFSEAVSPPGRA